MAFRTGALLKIQTTNVPQPLFGSWITAGIGSSSQNAFTVTLGAACSAGNDAAQLFTAQSFAVLIDPGGVNVERVWVQSVLNNTLTIGLKDGNPATSFAHVSGVFNTGTFIVPAREVNSGLVSFEDGGTGTFLFIGNSPTMTGTLSRITKIAKVAASSQPNSYSFTESLGPNPFQISELWAYGTANDLYNAAFVEL